MCIRGVLLCKRSILDRSTAPGGASGGRLGFSIIGAIVIHGIIYGEHDWGY